MKHRQNYKVKRELEHAAMIEAGLVSERHAGISSIEFQMTYYTRGINRVLMTRTLHFTPSNYAVFHLKCMEEGCTGGGFDLAPAVTDLENSGGSSARGKIFCKGSHPAIGHASLAYEVNIEYKHETA